MLWKAERQKAECLTYDVTKGWFPKGFSMHFVKRGASRKKKGWTFLGSSLIGWRYIVWKHWWGEFSHKDTFSYWESGLLWLQQVEVQGTLSHLDPVTVAVEVLEKPRLERDILWVDVFKFLEQNVNGIALFFLINNLYLQDDHIYFLCFSLCTCSEWNSWPRLWRALWYSLARTDSRVWAHSWRSIVVALSTCSESKWYTGSDLVELRKSISALDFTTSPTALQKPRPNLVWRTKTCLYHWNDWGVVTLRSHPHMAT